MEKHGYEYIWKSLKVDGEYCNNKSESLKKRNNFDYHWISDRCSLNYKLFYFSKTMAKCRCYNTKSTALLTSFAILITNEYISKLKKNWIMRLD